MGVRVFGAALGLLALAGCAAWGPNGDPSHDPSESQSMSPTPSDNPVELVFILPTDCVSFLSPSRLAEFEAAGLELLGGPGSVYGKDYFLEPTPEEQAGGITCLWGDESIPESSITISVAPVNLGNRAAIVNDLIAQGLNEVRLDDALTYGQLGDEVSAPGILNVVRNESWISVIEALGGNDRFDRATEIVDEVAALVYRPAN
jgi:hypothetical protein